MAPTGPGPGIPSVTTLQTQLASVQAAIAAIEGGAQAYTENGRSATKASLPSLYDREQTLLRRLSRATAALQGHSGLTAQGRVIGLGHG